MTDHAHSFAQTQRRHPTPAEDILWQALRGRRLAGLKFRRQTPLLGYTLDFVCLDHKLVIELDGKGHDRLADYDARRTADIEEQGFAVLRFPNEAVRTDIDHVLQTILAALPPLSHGERGRG
jgi:very-short-patch-repair endonuclease